MSKKLIYIQSVLIGAVFGAMGAVLLGLAVGSSAESPVSVMINWGFVVGGLFCGLAGGNFALQLYSAVFEVTERYDSQNTQEAKQRIEN